MRACTHTHTHTHSCILNVRVVSQGMQKNNKMADGWRTAHKGDKNIDMYMCSVDCKINEVTLVQGQLTQSWNTMLTEHILGWVDTEGSVILSGHGRLSGNRSVTECSVDVLGLVLSENRRLIRNSGHSIYRLSGHAYTHMPVSTRHYLCISVCSQQRSP